MLTLQESIEISDKLRLFEGEQTEFTDQQLDDAEFFIFKLNQVSFDTEVTLYNGSKEPLGTVSFEDADIAIAFIEELFELDDEDIQDLLTYSWAEPDQEFEELAQNQRAIGDDD